MALSFAIFAGVLVFAGLETATAEGIPETVLNSYCTFSVYEVSAESYQSASLKCANDAKSTLDDNFDSGFYPINYMQADNGAMTNAIADAIGQVKQRFPDKDLTLDIEINGYHPNSPSRRYAEIVAVIDVSSKMTATLGEKDVVQLKVQHAGVRADPDNKADNRLKVFAVSNVVLLNWDYQAIVPV